MNKALCAAVAAVAAGAITASTNLSAQSPPANAAPCQGASYHQFDFWIGKWNVYAPDGRKVGENVIEPIAGGCALLENWTAAKGFSGKSLNSFDANDQQWHQTWVDSSGSRLEIAGTGGGGKMALASKTQRIAWTTNADGSVRQLWESWDASKNAWVVAFDGRYVRT